VLSEEFTKRCGDRIEAFNDASTGRNVLRKGTDVRMGQQVVERGEVLTPGQVGLLAAAGHSKLQVYRNPSVTIIATGDEVVIPGRPLPEGKLYASNLATLGAWCKRYCLESRFRVVGDDAAELAAALERAVNETDTVITSGGAWTGDRDLVMDVLEQLGWEQVFHRVRIGPGKAVGFGLLRHRPVFTLPGGPPSNLMSFLQIVLPGLLKQSGRSEPFLPTRPVCMAAEVRGRSSDWTQYLFGRVEPQHATVLFRPLRGPSRLQDMAAAQAVVAIPEGRTVIPAGETVTAQWLL
jgi:molybdopterin molybdotransferase